VVKAIMESLKVDTKQHYNVLVENMINRTKQAQTQNKYAMIVVRVSDDQGNEISDYDIYLLAGESYRLDKLPKGFFVDRQMNSVNSSLLTFYLNQTKMKTVVDGKLGFRVVARPTEGFAYYSSGEFRSAQISVNDLLKENETLVLDIELKRHVDVHTFRTDPLVNQRVPFDDEEPKGIDVS